MAPKHLSSRRGSNRAIFALLVVAAVLGLVAPAGAGTEDEPTSAGTRSSTTSLLGLGKSDVRVVNTPQEPVPVSVQGTPSVQVAGTPTVQVAGTPTVAVAGTVPVLSTVHGDRFDAQAFLSIGQGSGNICSNCDDESLLDIPEGKAAVIEHVSATMRSTPGAVFDVSLLSTGGLHYVEMAYLDTDTFFNKRVYVGSHAITLYAPFFPGATEREIVASALSLGGLPTTFTTSITVRISGYFVDAPAT